MSKEMYIENRLLDEPTSRLEKPVNLEDVIDKCADFTIQTGEDDEIEKLEETDIAQAYSMEDLEPYCLTDVLEAASDDEDDSNYDSVSKSFPLFRKKMFNLTEDGKVMKMIEHESHDEKVPSEGNMVVYYHYAAYVELVETPFDCSRLRQKRPESKTLGIGEIIPGLEIAIRSMHRGEKSKFLVHPDLAFGMKGIPPRIPPEATILFSVELIDFSADAKEEFIPTRDRTFNECLELAKNFRASGNTSIKRDKNVDGAISKYKKALQILIEATFDNDEDEQRRKKEMLPLYTNLAVCYTQKNRPKMVCNMCNNARTDCHPIGEKHPKLLYLSGKALRTLGSYEESLRRLREALRLKPLDENILKELQATQDARKKYQDAEKLACRKMFGYEDPNGTETIDEEDEALLETVGADFKETIRKTMDFMESTGRKSETLNSASYSYKEKEFIRKLCARRNFLYKSPNENTIIIIKKSVPN